ncbi:MAG: T9SS type A sorting domain-containing protein [Ferruginibacter sp.]
MKPKFLLLALGSLIAGGSFAQDSWEQKKIFGGGNRHGTIHFSIGDKGYVGTGSDDITIKSDFWEFDPIANVWTQKADFGGGIRAYGTGFAIGNKGYAGTGIVASYDWRKDMWEYDPAANTWRQVADFAGGLRYTAVGFGIGSKGYMGTGNYRVSPSQNAIYYNDFWEFDPAIGDSGTWTPKANVPEQGRTNAVGICIGNKGYIGTGVYYYDTRKKDFWEYDPATDSWTGKADLPGIQRYGASGFAIGNKGYLAAGWYYTGQNDLWEFDPATNIWTQRESLPADFRHISASFAIGNKGYLGLGSNSIGALNDFWEYSPPCLPLAAGIADVYAVNPGGNANTIYIGYGPAALTLTASASGGYPMPGSSYSYKWSTGETTASLIVSPSAAGTYTYTVTITDDNGCAANTDKTVYVTDIRCGSKMDKVTICKIPPGNPANAQTICISKNAVANQLSNGSYLGSCSEETMQKTVVVKEPEMVSEEMQSISISPNPNNGIFNLEPVNLHVTDVKVYNQGGTLVMEQAINAAGKKSIPLKMKGMPAGVYYVLVICAEGNFTRKMMLE